MSATTARPFSNKIISFVLIHGTCVVSRAFNVTGILLPLEIRLRTGLSSDKAIDLYAGRPQFQSQ
jgi:hypothetical protein